MYRGHDTQHHKNMLNNSYLQKKASKEREAENAGPFSLERQCTQTID